MVWLNNGIYHLNFKISNASQLQLYLFYCQGNCSISHHKSIWWLKKVHKHLINYAVSHSQHCVCPTLWSVKTLGQIMAELCVPHVHLAMAVERSNMGRSLSSSEEGFNDLAGDSPHKGPTMHNFVVFFVVSWNEQLSCQWSEMPWHSCDVTITQSRGLTN